MLSNAAYSVRVWFLKSWSPLVGLHHQRSKVERLRTPNPNRLQDYSKPIRGAERLTPPKGVDLAAAQRWVRMWTAKRIRLDDPDFSFESFDAHDGKSRQQREKVRKFGAALQAVLLKTENWDGTPRA